MSASVTDIDARRRWMSVLAKAEADELESVWRELPATPDYRLLRGPEVGLVMVQIDGRAAATPAVIASCDESLLGVEALEALALAVGPDRGLLTPTRSYAVRLGAVNA